MPVSTASNPTCEYDRTRLLALDQAKFDQDMTGGWRALARKPDCKLAAADLLRDYRQAHRNEASILYWHEGQLRAVAGQSAEAIVLLERARRRADEDFGGWNPYVDATVAFLRKDRPAFDDAQKRLAAIPPPTGYGAPSVKDGYIEARMANGESRKLRWPMNIDVVEGLAQCFDKPYKLAYSAKECRPPSAVVGN
jgi:hypothetical protein